MNFFKKNKTTIVWPVIIFLLSSIFRIFFLDLIEFKSDEATTVYQTIQFFNHPYLIQRGIISGTGMYNFPLFNYLMVGLGILSQDPQFLSWTIALVNSILVSIFFLLTKRYYGLTVSLLASLLLAFSPWGVLFSRKIWAQDLINLFLIPFLYLLHELILRKNTKAILPLFLLLTLLTQLHGSGLFLSAVTLFVLLVSRIRLSFKSVLVGILIGLIPAIPYILFQINSSCPDCAAFSKYQQSFRTFDFYNVIRPFQIISGLGYHFILGKSYNDFVTAYPLVNQLRIIFATTFPVTLTGILFVAFKRQKYLFLTIYFIAIPFLYLITKTPAYMHYFVIIIPMSILLFVVPISNAYFFVRSRFLKTAVMAYFLLVLISNIGFLTSFNHFLEVEKQIEGDYGSIYSVTKSFIEKETNDYKNLSYYHQLVSFAYIYSESNNLHSKLGEFFLEKGDTKLAAKEFQKLK